MKYAKASTRRGHLGGLARYFDWLRKAKGITLTPDELILDNLRCVFESGATDILRKRRHLDYLDEYINQYLVSKGDKDSGRITAASQISQFYKRNDSPLFGDFQVSQGKVIPPPPPLSAADIRAVLKTLPVQQRTPLLVAWQSGIEISRVLNLTWNAFEKMEYPQRLDFFGRKKHRKPYSTFVGRDSLNHLKLWRELWKENVGREPRPDDLVFLGKRSRRMDQRRLNLVLKKAALPLARQGAVRNATPQSWHVHYLRHSFETEASHAGVRGEIRDYFMGHLDGIMWTYNHRDEIHPEDLVKEYLRIELYLSLEPGRQTVEAEFEEREKSLIKRIERAEALLAELKSELCESQPVPSQAVRYGV